MGDGSGARRNIIESNNNISNKNTCPLKIMYTRYSSIYSFNLLKMTLGIIEDKQFKNKN